MRGGTATATGLLAGVGLDLLLGDPRRGHPVAAFGALAARAERALYADHRARGAAYTVVLVGGAAALSGAAERAVPPGVPRLILVAVATWTVVGATSLGREAGAVSDHLQRGDLPAARRQVRSLVGRRTEDLPAGEVARAAIESVAENSSDAVVAPLLWGAVAGVPGLVAYRAVNTLDAMVGHRSPRYARFGTASARLDDAANWVPARVTAVLVALVSGRPRAVGAAVAGGARRHPSPNSGWCEAAFAGALGVRLGGTNVYAGRVEHRAELGTGRAVEPADIARAVRLQRRVTLAAAVLAAAVATGRRRGGRRRGAR